MDYIDACKALGLNPNFSEEEYILRLKELSRKYHPDNYAKVEDQKLVQQMEEEMKEINSAKSYFKDCYRKYGDYNYFYTKDCLNKYLRNLINKAKSYRGKEFLPEARMINPLIIALQYELLRDKTLQDMDVHFEKFRNDLRIVYDNIKKDYEPYLEENTVLNYDCSVKDFVKGLDSIKDSFIKKARLMVQEEVLKYELYPDYMYLKIQIAKIKEEALEEMEESEFKNFALSFTKMQNNIKGIFDKHFAILKGFQNIRSYLVDRYDEASITNAIKAIENGIEVWYINTIYLDILKDLIRTQTFYRSNYDFLETTKMLEDIEEKINRAKEFEENKMKVKEIFVSVTAKFQSKMKLYNLTFKLDAIMKTYDIYGRFLEAYKDVINGNLEFSSFFRLSMLTFEDFLQDEEIFKSLDEEKLTIK